MDRLLRGVHCHKPVSVIFYIFATIALVSAVSRIIYGKVVRYPDEKQAPVVLFKTELPNKPTQGQAGLCNGDN